MAPIVYVLTDIAAALLWREYSYTAQTISETFAIAAPTRPLVLVRGIIYSLLTFGFGVGIWRTAGERRSLRHSGVLLMALAGVDIVAPFAGPMHLRGVERSLTDTLHIVLATVDVLLILAILVSGAGAFGRRFRNYSIVTIATVIVFGTLAGLDGPRLAAGHATPWLGVTERLSVYSYMVWMGALAVGLRRRTPQGV